MQSPVKIRAGIVGVALAFFLIIQLLSQYPTFVETYYSNGLYPLLTLFISGLSNQTPVSLSEVSLWLALLVVIPWFIRRILTKKMSVGRALLNLTSAASLLFITFYLFWGLNYLRLPLQTKLNLDHVALKIDAFDSTFVDIIRQANELNYSYSVKDVVEINELIEASYEEVLDRLQLPKVPGSKRLKTFAVNWILNKTTTSGWFSPFFHEVHYNSDLLIIELPFVIAHEKAHQMGYTSETEANFLAYLVCQNSPDPLIQYSGYFSAVSYFLLALRKDLDRRQFFYSRIQEGVQLDLTAVRERWKSQRGFISHISDKTYDLYLRANQVKDGTQSYVRVVDLIVKYYEQQNTDAK